MSKYKKKVQKFYIFIFIIFTILLILWGNFQTISAATSNEADYNTALKTAPKGLSWDGGAFSKANFDDNSAQVVASQNPNSKDTSILKMTNKSYQVGGIWSNFDNDNFFNINHNQTVSMWLYFGYAKSYTNPDQFFPGDGMAFVLHNDPRGINAHSTGLKDGKTVPGDGETLGVWGTDWDMDETNSSKIAKTAIQNSVAIEFDTFLDRVTNYDDLKGEGASFDVLNSGSSSRNYAPHIAFGYPGEATNYVNQYVTNASGNKKHYFILNHLNSYGSGYDESLNLVDSKWHHLTVNWEKPQNGSNTGTLIYHYDDKDPATGEINTSGLTRSINVDTNKFSSSDGKLYWGFTGSTGRYTENNLIAFESIPSFVDAEASANIFDDTSNTEVNDGDHVNTNDDISYKYNLKYIGWTKNCSNIKTKIDIPDNMSFSSGEVTYANGQQESIPSSVFNSSQINYQLQQTLDTNNRTATITLHGKAAKTSTTQLTVPKAHGHFDGDNLITDTDAHSFIIDPKSITLESSTPDIIKVKKDTDVDIPAQVNYLGSGSIPDFSKLTIYQKIGDNDPMPIKNLIDSSGKFTLHISSSQLTSATTPVSFYVKDDSTANTLGQTNTLNRSIQIGGTVAFGDVSSNVAFKNINYGGNKQIIPRIDDWHVNVIDSREKGSSWTVQADATPLVNANKKTFNGNLIYRATPDSHSFDLSNNVNIAQYTKPNDQTDTKDITVPWTKESGILLSMNDNNNTAGQYRGTINWTLLDSLQNI